MLGNFQVRLVNQFKRCWEGPFKTWAAQAHSLSNLTGLTESSLVSHGQILLQTLLCV